MERNYGTLNGVTSPAVNADTIKQKQTYYATHEGSQRLPFMRRSFISFTYGGKAIEDFDLIATTVGDRLSRKGYSEFNDITSTYDNLDGQQYWNTHFSANTLDLNLSTDGIDQKKLDEFLYWFRPGEAKELILAEHPNRAILARIAVPPQLELLPFEGEVQINISGNIYTTKTTLYKGDIQLSFVMDDPFWYSKSNILGIKDPNNDYYVNDWIDANGNRVNIFASQDALKILYEDGIPLGSMIQNDMLLGNNAYAIVEDRVDSKIYVPSTANGSFTDIDGLQGVGACIAGTVGGITYKGVIAGALIDASGNGITSLAQKQKAYFYYSGNAPAPTILDFTMQPAFNNILYVTDPRNIHSQYANVSSIFIGSEHEQILRFTSPNVFSSYNKAMEIIKACVYEDSNYTWEYIRERIRNEVRHVRVREWATTVINYGNVKKSSPGALTNPENLQYYMLYFLLDKEQTQNIVSQTNPKVSNPSASTARFIINSETGSAIGKFTYRTVSNNADVPVDMLAWRSYGEFTEVEEDVGDMLRSNYIILRDRNHPTDNGTIVAYNENTIAGKTYSHYISHDCLYPLTNIKITYKNMYL